MTREFDASDYPEGCRCACCRRLFEDGDTIIDREVTEDWTTPTCEACAAVDAPLETGHPFGPGEIPIACADGFVRDGRADAYSQEREDG